MYARQFLDQLEKPDVDLIKGLSPAIAIEQRGGGLNPRSTVATATEIYDFLRVMWAAAGIPHDPETGERLERMSAADIVYVLAAVEEGTRVVLLALFPQCGNHLHQRNQPQADRELRFLARKNETSVSQVMSQSSPDGIDLCARVSGLFMKGGPLRVFWRPACGKIPDPHVGCDRAGPRDRSYGRAKDRSCRAGANRRDHSSWLAVQCAIALGHEG